MTDFFRTGRVWYGSKNVTLPGGSGADEETARKDYLLKFEVGEAVICGVTAFVDPDYVHAGQFLIYLSAALANPGQANVPTLDIDGMLFSDQQVDFRDTGGPVFPSWVMPISDDPLRRYVTAESGILYVWGWTRVFSGAGPFEYNVGVKWWSPCD